MWKMHGDKHIKTFSDILIPVSRYGSELSDLRDENWPVRYVSSRVWRPRLLGRSRYAM
jgi:hypothetical protein